MHPHRREAYEAMKARALAKKYTRVEELIAKHPYRVVVPYCKQIDPWKVERKMGKVFSALSFAQFSVGFFFFDSAAHRDEFLMNYVSTDVTIDIEHMSIENIAKRLFLRGR